MYIHVSGIDKPIRPLDITADVLFIVDSSSEVGQDNFVKEKDFIKSLAKSLNVSPEKSRVSVIIYSSTPRVEIKFGDYTTSSDFDRALDKLSYVGKTRRMDLALESAARVLSGARSSVPRIAILLTSGRQSQEPGARHLADAVQPLQSLGSKVYVVAVGKESSSQELSVIVEGPKDIFSVASFGELKPRARFIAADVADRSSKCFVLSVTIHILEFVLECFEWTWYKSPRMCY